MPTISETTSLNEKVYFNLKTQNEGGEVFEGTPKGPSQDDNDSSGDQEAASVFGKSKSPLMNVSATSLNEESVQSPAVKDKQSDETIENLVALFRDFLEVAPNPAASNHTHAQRNTAWRKRLFGLNEGLSPEAGSNNRYDYEQKYPRDQPGEEAGDNARVWLTYLDEAEAFDRERVEGWKETADVLLVFAGLFSGVITTFVSQASQSLQRDNTQVSASLLFEIAQLLRAQSSGTPINNIPKSTLTPTSPFIPSTNAFWVNGLWFTSLAITLSTALFAVLAKQWLYYHISSITGTAHEKVRQLRFKGFELWKVGAIIDLLPILLHLAVGGFLTGIIILLFPLDVRVAWTVVVITGLTYLLYFTSVILPIRYPECPYTTSSTIYVGVLVFFLQRILKWISGTLEKRLQAIWRRINTNTRYTIQHHLHYTQGLFRYAFIFTMGLVGFVRRGFRRFRDAIFTEKLPKFTNWREENIKKAVKNAISLDSEALKWLYETSPSRSVHRIITRADVHAILWQVLEVSETNVADLRYGLCLDLRDEYGFLRDECGFLRHRSGHWRLLWSVLDVEGSRLEAEEYRGYSRIAESVINGDYEQILKDAVNDYNLKFPLVMWRRFFTVVPRDVTVVSHILIHGQSLFEWKSTCNTSVVSFDNEELGQWKFEYLFRYFVGGTQPDYSPDGTFETCYLLLFTVYRNLTSKQPVISNKEQRQQSLYDLFDNFWDWLYPNVSSEQYFAFFIDICCVDAFWSESMTNDGRWAAVRCLDEIWELMDTDATKRFPFTEYLDLSPIYQWCSRDDLDQILSWRTTPMFTLLLMPQNRDSLCAILSNDSDAATGFSIYLKNLQYCSSYEEKNLHHHLIDFFMSVDPNGSLFTVLYNSSVLVQLWKFLELHKLNEKKILSIVKSKLDPRKLHDLHCIMIVETQSEQDTDRRSALEVSAREFGQSIGVAYSQLELSVKNQSTGEERNHDSEERAQEPNENENPIVRRVKKISNIPVLLAKDDRQID